MRHNPVMAVIYLGLLGLTYYLFPDYECSRSYDIKPVSGTNQDQVCQIAADFMGVDRATVKPETTLAELKMDELDGVELMLILENHFDAELPDAEFALLAESPNWREQHKATSLARLAGLLRDARSTDKSNTGSPPEVETEFLPVADLFAD
ncbi:MAG: phosphopantetheine-binding protein [Pirellulales bacterium]|nr:phosphopantetheine-binding protein [Pirellulales bacterium]